VPRGTVGELRQHGLLSAAGRDSVAVQTDALAATTDGKHILGAAVIGGGVTLTDIGVNIPTAEWRHPVRFHARWPPTGPGVETLSALTSAPLSMRRYAQYRSHVNATAVIRWFLAGLEPGLYHLHGGYNQHRRAALLCARKVRTGVGYVTLRRKASAPITPPGRRLHPGRLALLCLHRGRQHDPLHQRSAGNITPRQPPDTQQISPNLPLARLSPTAALTWLHLFGAGYASVPATCHSRQAALHHVTMRSSSKQKGRPRAGLSAFGASDLADSPVP
jgi:hypothetical protein